MQIFPTADHLQDTPLQKSNHLEDLENKTESIHSKQKIILHPVAAPGPGC